MHAALLLFALALAPSAHAEDGAPAGGVALTDLTVGLPTCSASPTSAPEIDIALGCVGQVCVGMSLDAIAQILGDPPECRDPYELRGSTHCKFGDYLSVALQPDNTTVDVLFWMGDPSFTTADGLGIGSSLACFIDRFADNAVSVSTKVEDGRLHWRSIHFRNPSLIVTVDPDGRASKLQLSKSRTRIRVPPAPR